MGKKILHNVDGRFNVYLDEDHVELARLFLKDGLLDREVIKLLREDGLSLETAVFILKEAKNK